MRKEDLHHRDAEHDARKDQRHRRQLIEQEGAAAAPRDEPTGSDHQNHDSGRAAGPDHQRLPDLRQIGAGAQHSRIIGESEEAEAFAADRLAERHQRQPEQARRRHDENDEEIAENDGAAQKS